MNVIRFYFFIIVFDYKRTQRKNLKFTQKAQIFMVYQARFENGTKN